jgi:SulP family sulfate permease
MKLVHGFRRGSLRGDLFGGVTAAVVALPLALAFGVASGAGPIAGLYGAIFVGFFAALFGGTPSQVSGPTGPMTVVMAAVVMKYANDPALIFGVVVLGGLFQILFGAIRLGSLISLVPFTVISGFMSGIGVIIITLQLPPLFGYAAPPGILDAMKALPGFIASPNAGAMIVGFSTLAVVYLMPSRLTRIVPAPLVALTLGTLIVWKFMPEVPILGAIPTGFPEIRMPHFRADVIVDVIGTALVLALLGTLDSLLTSLVADSMTGTFHQSNRELIGQGIGNTLAGLFGGIPGAGATMRTVVNIRTGGTTPLSGMIHALILLAIVLGLGPLASSIPHAVLAGILIKVGVDIIDWGYLKRAARAPRPGVMVMFLTLGLTVFVDLIIAVAVGLVASSMLFIKRMQSLQMASIRTATGGQGEVVMTDEETSLLACYGESVMLCEFEGPFSFAAAKAITEKTSLVGSAKVVILDLSNVTLIDTSVALALEDAVSRVRQAGAQPLVVGLRAPVRQVLERLNVLSKLPSGTVVAGRMEALRKAGAMIASAASVERTPCWHPRPDQAPAD